MVVEHPRTVNDAAAYTLSRPASYAYNVHSCRHGFHYEFINNFHQPSYRHSRFLFVMVYEQGEGRVCLRA